MRIGIRADGGKKIGMGHIMRTLVLAKELSKTEDVFYICRIDNPLTDKYKAGINKIKEEGYFVKFIDENKVLHGLKNINCDMLITDSYDVDELYFDETKKNFSKTVYIDDINFFNFYNVDILINQNIGGESFKYNVAKETQLLLGTNYVMLRDEFRENSVKITNKNVKDILITLGGADPYNITSFILKSLMNLEYNYHVIIGPSFENIEELKNVEINNQNIKLYFNANMSEVMKRCDLAISACGSTLYELAALNIPILGIIAADNQKCVAEEMHKKGIIKLLGWYNNLYENMIVNEIKILCSNYELRKNMSICQKLINKNGVDNLVSTLTNL